MSNNSLQSNILAHWHFTNDQWREFLYYEKIEFENNTFADVRKIIGFGVAGLFLVALIVGSRGGVAGFLFALIAGSLFFGFCYLIHSLVRKSAEQKMQTEKGEVKVSESEVSINGAIYDWRGKWEVPTIGKDYVYVGETKMLLLRFKSLSWVNIRKTRHRIDKNFIVPVQPCRESEADYVIEKIRKGFKE